MKAPQEYKVISLRECPTPEALQMCDTPERAAEYWQHHIAPHPYFNPECECLVALLLNTRRRVKGHQLLSFGTTDTLLVSPGLVYRAAVIAAASALVVMHNLCNAAHKLCYVQIRVMCSARLAGLALHRLSGRRECHGFA